MNTTSSINYFVIWEEIERDIATTHCVKTLWHEKKIAIPYDYWQNSAVYKYFGYRYI